MAKESSKKNSIRIQDIAQEIGTSASTVSRALNDHPKISKQMKEKVLDVAIQMGYKPAIPSLMSGNESKTIALILPSISDAYYSEIFKSVQEFSLRKNFALMVCETDYDIAKEQFYFEQMELMKIRGIIYLAHQHTSELSILKDFIRKRIPLVFIHENELKEMVPTVILDVYQGLHESIQHLKSNGAINIALCLNHQNPVYREIEKLFVKLLEIENLPYSEDLVFSDNDLQAVISDVQKSRPIPDAMIVSTTMIAYSFQQLMRKSNGQLKDMLLIGLNSDDFDGFARPKLTQLKLPSNQIGEEAAQLMFKRIESGVDPKSKVLFSRLIIKSSTMRI